MKDKHIHIASDSDLLKYVYKQVDIELLTNKKTVTYLIWVKFFFYFFITAICYSSLFWIQNAGQFIFCFVIYGLISLLFAFNFSHDFAHNTIFESKKLNNIGFTLIYTLVGAHAEAWKLRHIHSHHYAPNVEEYDSDMKISKLIRVIPQSDFKWYNKFQHLYAPIAYTSYSLFWIFVKDFKILYSKDEYTSIKGFWYHVSFWIQKATYLTIILVLPLMFSNQNWSVIMLGFIFMHIIQSLFLLLTFFMTHHVESTEYPSLNENGDINYSWFMNQIRSSNDMHPFSEVANFILGGFNNHVAHHLFPHVHHAYYPKINKILYRILNENNIEINQTTYIGGIVSHFKLLKRMSFSLN